MLVLESGRFAIGWGEQAKMLGCDAEVMHAPPRAAIRPDDLEDRLRREGRS